MKEWRGTLIQGLLIVCLTLLAIKSTDQYVLHSVIGIFGASVGHAMSRARQESSRQPGAGFSIPPILGAIIGGIVAVGSAVFAENVIIRSIL